jgi:hypothetical protein
MPIYIAAAITTASANTSTTVRISTTTMRLTFLQLSRIEILSYYDRYSNRLSTGSILTGEPEDWLSVASQQSRRSMMRCLSVRRIHDVTVAIVGDEIGSLNMALGLRPTQRTGAGLAGTT